jgi:hypothetical protein
MVNSFVAAPMPMGPRSMLFEHNSDFIISHLEDRLSDEGAAVVRKELVKRDNIEKQFRDDMFAHRENIKKEIDLENFDKDSFIKSGLGILKIFEAKARADSEIFADTIEQLSLEDRRIFVNEMENMFKRMPPKSPPMDPHQMGGMPPSPPPSQEGEMLPPPMHMHDDMPK